MADYYEVLDVPRDAELEEISAAYKRKAQVMHPDKKTGDKQQFIKISEAFRVLMNPDRRARYDRGEDVNKSVRTNDAIAKERLGIMFHEQIAKYRPGQDMIATMRTSIMAGKAAMDKDKQTSRTSIVNAEKLRKRVHYSGVDKEIDIFTAVLNDIIRNNERQIEIFENEAEIQDIVLKMLDDYEAEVDAPKETIFRQEPKISFTGGWWQP